MYVFLQILTPQEFLGNITKLLKQRKDLNYGKSTCSTKVSRCPDFLSVQVTITLDALLIHFEEVFVLLRLKPGLMMVSLPTICYTQKMESISYIEIFTAIISNERMLSIMILNKTKEMFFE